MKLDFYGQRELNSSLAGQLPSNFTRLNAPLNADVSAHNTFDLVVVSQFANSGFGGGGQEATISCVGLYEATSGHLLGTVDYLSTLKPLSTSVDRASVVNKADCGRCCVHATPEQLFVPHRALIPEGSTCIQYVDNGICAKASQQLVVLGKRGGTVMLNRQLVTASGSAIIRTGGLPQVKISEKSLMNLGTSDVPLWNSTVASWMLLAQAGPSSTASYIVSYPVTVGHQHPHLAGTVLDTVSADVVALDPFTFQPRWRLAIVQPRVLAVLGNSVLSTQGAVHLPALLNATQSSRTGSSLLQVRVLKLRASDGHLLWLSAPLATLELRNGTLVDVKTGKQQRVPAFVTALHPSALLVCQQGRFVKTEDGEVDVGVAALGHASGTLQWSLQTYVAQLQYDSSAPNGISALNNAPGGHAYPIKLPVRCGGAMIVDDVRLYAPLVAHLPLNLTDPSAGDTTLALAVLSQTISAPSSTPWVHFASSLNRTGTARVRSAFQAADTDQDLVSVVHPLHVPTPVGISGAQLVPQFLDLIISSRGRIALELNLASTVQGVAPLRRTQALTLSSDDMPDDDLPVQRQNAGVEVTAIGCPPEEAGFWSFLTAQQLLFLAICLLSFRVLTQGVWAFTRPIDPPTPRKPTAEGAALAGAAQNAQTSDLADGSSGRSRPWWAGLNQVSKGSVGGAGGSDMSPGASGSVEDFLLGTIRCFECPVVRDRVVAGGPQRVRASPAANTSVSQLGPLTRSSRSPVDGESSGDDSSEDAPLVPSQGTADWRAVASQVLDEQYSGWHAASTVCLQTVCPCLETRRSQRQAYRSSAMSAIAQAQSSSSRSRGMKQMMQDIMCGCNARCGKAWCGCNRLSPQPDSPHSGCRWGRAACSASPKSGAAVPWLFLTFVNIAITSALVMWSASDALIAIDELVDKIEQPTAFYREFIIDREPTESFGCPSPTLAACYCEGSVDGTVAPIWDGDRMQDNTACQAPEDATILQTCTLACTATLRNTGNCASSVFHYSCSCGTEAQSFQDTSLNINASLSTASMRRPGLVVGLANCKAHYTALGSSVIACTAVFVITGIFAVLGATWMRVPCCVRQRKQTASASLYGICRQRRSLTSWFHYIAALYTISAVLFVFWQILLTQNGRVCSGADGDTGGSQEPRTSESVQPDDSYILQHITGCALGAGWHTADLEGSILRKVRQAWFFNLLAFCSLAVDSLLAAGFASCYWRRRGKQLQKGEALSLCCVRLQNLLTS